MFKLTCHIKIGKYSFRNVVDVSIDSSWETQTDTASITIPRKIQWRGKPIYDLISKGDPVSIRLGYDDQNSEIFQGYVTKISARIPTVIECEDASWLLKQASVTKSYKAVGLTQLLQDVLPKGIMFSAPVVGLGQFRISNATAAQVLDELKSTFFLHSWFRAGKLYVGFAYVAALQKVHKLSFDRNIPADGNDLDFVKEDQVKIKLKIVNIKKDNTKEEFEFGDKDGEERTLHYYGMSAQDIKKLGQEEVKRLRYTGYRGSLATFGIPVVSHGDIVTLVDPEYPERDGSYLVKSVATAFGSGGNRQTLTLDTKV